MHFSKLLYGKQKILFQNKGVKVKMVLHLNVIRQTLAMEMMLRKTQYV